ncbi:MAG TPA: MFS transporter [Sphingobacterium bovisgrunnientis]|jgi:maltose/moltooligosaccharide transporter|nr:MFS transporter [Sphingobacterium bovisgrunnientis]
MQEKTTKSTLQITSLCIGFLGIQIGFALQAGNVTRILQNYGADLTQVSLFWLIAPLSGAVIQPLIGYWSDRNINSGSTRTPYLLTGGIFCALSLFALPNSNLLIVLWSPLLIGALLIIIIDLSFNVSMHPLRAAITDYLPTFQQPKGFAIQTFLISIGAIIGSTLPYILHEFLSFSSTSESQQIADNVKWSFYIGASLLLITVLITAKAITSNSIKPISTFPLKSNKTFYLPQIPKKMWQLGLIQFFSWAGFFLVWIYMTPAIAQHIYAEFDYSSQSKLYAEAANFTGILFGCYHLAASVFSLTLPYLYKKTNIITTHMIALFIGGIGLLVVFNSNTVDQLYIPMLCIGIAWASILASPFALLSRLIPQQKIGLYFGIFNLFITVPQILVGLSSGILIQDYFQGRAIFAIVIAGISLLLAGSTAFIFRKSLKL